MVKVDKEGAEVENGMTVENVSMSLDMMKDEDQKVLFSGASAGDQVVFDVWTGCHNWVLLKKPAIIILTKKSKF